ncbi:hypothetical protein [Chryseobacterium indoltheticum]|uniref:hypothetical protein n=1 Tax=Chryseobacterium indoltheticum TaxID=254 RepID=UPI0019146140|nr:hypothetical protein [Chryseobacterium indoltheticum]QQQ28359.1 hypothetical protein JJL46_20210 [Chryseobacterium indoltheticum]
MKKKLLLRLCLILTVLLSLPSCTNEDLYSSSENEKQEILSKSPWKEDQVYIRKVQKIFLQNANLQYFERKYGTVHWDYAMSFGQFDESYLVVPILKGNTVVTAMKVYRIDDRVYFREKNDPEFISFFTDIIFKEISGIDEKVVNSPTSAASKTIEYKCTYRTITVGCFESQSNCEPLSSTVSECKWRETGGGSAQMEICNPLECENGGGGADPGFLYPDPPQDDPCLKASSRNTKAKSIMNKSKVSAAKTEATKTLATDTEEKSFSFGKDSNGDYKTSAVVSGTSNSTNIPGSNGQFTIEGTAHTHLNGYYNAFSNGDLYSFQAANANTPTMLYSFAFASDGSTYLLSITDPVKYATFAAQFPKSGNIDGNNGFKEGTELYNTFKSATEQFISQNFSEDDAFAYATAHILNKYDTGATLSQQDDAGNFNSIFINETITPPAPGETKPTSTFSPTADCNLQ